MSRDEEHQHEHEQSDQKTAPEQPEVSYRNKNNGRDDRGSRGENTQTDAPGL